MVYVFLADGFEEIEGLTVVDLLRRAEIETMMVSIQDTPAVMGAHKIPVTADLTIANVPDKAPEMVVLPGGMPGTLNLKADERVRSKVAKNLAEDRYIAAICAAPSVFADMGILKGKTATSYPNFEECLKEAGANYIYDQVAVDGKIITSRGMGTAIAFAGKIIEVLKDKETAERILDSIVYE